MTRTEDLGVHYLRRDDNRTLYELGRYVRRWRRVLGGGSPVKLPPEIPTRDVVTLLEVASLQGDWTRDADHERGIYRLGKTPDGQSSYLTIVVEHIRQWSAGMPFRFVDERGFADWEDPGTTWRLDDAITASRYDLPSCPGGR